MIDIVIVYILGIKLAGITLSGVLFYRGMQGFWIETMFKYYLMSFLFFALLHYLVGEDHLDPSIVAVDIIGLCWLWHRSKGGVRDGTEC